MGKTWFIFLIIYNLNYCFLFIGTCHYKTATDYYTAMETLYKSLNIPDIQSIKNPTLTSIKDAFLKSNPKLFASAIYISMNEENRLKEIKICYDLNNKLVNCRS